MDLNFVRQILLRSLATLGVARAASTTDPLRWSTSDLATDLAPLVGLALLTEAQLDRPLDDDPAAYVPKSWRQEGVDAATVGMVRRLLERQALPYAGRVPLVEQWLTAIRALAALQDTLKHGP